MNTNFLPLLAGWLMDKCFGDPPCLPHPVVAFGRWISFFEQRANNGTKRYAKGCFWTVATVCGTFALSWALLITLYLLCSQWATGGIYIYHAVTAILIFYGLAGTTLIREVRAVFDAAGRSLDEGRRQVGRIVGRNTEELSGQEVRTAALETLAENLSDGVIAPLFWLYLLGLPGMLTYKMINTLDSMIGYRNERYREFGRTAAHIDDWANYIPSRLTALLMAAASLLPHRGTPTARTLKEELRFIMRFGKKHASPNSGYPEAALAGILDCRFGGPHHYFGEYFFKPYIGSNARAVHTEDMHCAVAINLYAEIMMVALGIGLSLC